MGCARRAEEYAEARAMYEALASGAWSERVGRRSGVRACGWRGGCGLSGARA